MPDDIAPSCCDELLSGLFPIKTSQTVAKLCLVPVTETTVLPRGLSTLWIAVGKCWCLQRSCNTLNSL